MEQTDHEIIAMEHSFHGRTMGALSVTGNPKYREAFEPMIGNIRFAKMNDFESVLSQVTDKTCAILFETVQGEGGIYPAKEEFMKKIKALCEEKDILLILDEIQCGMGRTGEMYAWQKIRSKARHYDHSQGTWLWCAGRCIPDDRKGRARIPLTSGDHGTTYGGNPLAAAAINVVLDLFGENHIIDNVQKTGAYLWKRS